MDRTWRAVVAVGVFVLCLSAPAVEVRAGRSAPPTVYSGRLGGPIDVAVGDKPRVIASLPLPPGRFVVWGKLQLDSTAPDDQTPRVTCRLRGARAADAQTGWAWLGPAAHDHESSAMALQVATRITGGSGQASLACAGSDPAIAQDIVLVAMSVGKLRTIDLAEDTSRSHGAGAPFAIHATRPGALPIPTGATRHVADLALSTGAWWVTTSFVIDDTDTDPEDPDGSELWCRLRLGDEVDSAEGSIPPTLFESDRRVITLETAAWLTSASHARVDCHAVDGNLEVRSLHLTAIRLGSLRRREATGPVHVSGHGAPRVDHLFTDADQVMSLSVTTVASLDVGSQPRLVVAKVSVVDSLSARLVCAIGGGGGDRSFRDQGSGYTLPLVMTTDPAGPTTVVLRCVDRVDALHPVVLNHIKLTAMVLGARIVRSIAPDP